MFEPGERIQKRDAVGIYKILACHNSDEYVMVSRAYTKSKYIIDKIMFEDIIMNEEKKEKLKKLRREKTIKKLLK